MRVAEKHQIGVTGKIRVGHHEWEGNNAFKQEN
jgi:hypothetical protein